MFSKPPPPSRDFSRVFLDQTQEWSRGQVPNVGLGLEHRSWKTLVPGGNVRSKAGPIFYLLPSPPAAPALG